MKLILYHRHIGCHSPVKDIEIPCLLSDVYNNERVDEEKLLSFIPDDFLMSKVENTLLMVSNGKFSVGQIALKYFRPWSKYFDAYCLELNE